MARSPRRTPAAVDISALELNLREAEAKLEAMSRSQAIVEFDMDGRITSANANFLDAMGYDLAEVVGRRHDMFLREGQTETEAHARFWSDLRAGQHLSGEFVLVGRHGQDVWVRGAYNPILGPDGEPFKVLQSATVITAEKLQAADFSGQIAAIAKSQAVIEFDMHGAIISANQVFLDTFGFEAFEVLGRHHAMFVDNETSDSKRYAEFWSKLRRGEYTAGEYKRMGKGGREIWIQATYNPIFDLNGKPYKVVKFATDVTANKVRTADQAGQIAAIAKAQAVVEFDLNGLVIAANENFEALSGYSADDLQGQHHRIFIDPEQVRQKSYEDFWNALRSGEHRAREYPFRRKDGAELWLHVSYNPIADLNGKPFKVVMYAKDVTEAFEQRRTEAQAQAARAVAESAAAAKSDFLANMSHELRTPLTSILGFSRLLKARKDLVDIDREYVELIHTAGETLLAVVNDILDFSKLEVGGTQLEPTPFSVRALTEGAAALLRQQAVNKGLRLSCELNEDAALIGDAPRLRQVLLNLIGTP